MAIWYIIKQNKNVNLINKIFKPVNIMQVENKIIAKIPSEKYVKKIAKKIYDRQKQDLVISQEFDKKSFENICNILDGRWLFKYIIPNIIDYVANKSNAQEEKMIVSILTNDNNQNNLKLIYKIASKVKDLNIVTENRLKFEKIEEYLLSKQGIAVHVTNNKKRALLKSNIIINLDYNQTEFNKYYIPKKAVIIHIKEPVNLRTKRFEGINCNYYKINMPIEAKEWFIKNELFGKINNEILFESIVYYKNSYEAIEKEVENVGIHCLIGNNGDIQEEEYTKIFT